MTVRRWLGWLTDQGQQVALESALVKLYLSECFLQSSQDALRWFAGAGGGVAPHP